MRGLSEKGSRLMFPADELGDNGASLSEVSKTFGRSFAPGGSLFLLGLPWGVDIGVVKPFSLAERVCRRGGGAGNSILVWPMDMGAPGQ